MSGGAKPHTDVSPHGTHQTVALGELLNVLCETTTVILNSELTDFTDIRSVPLTPQLCVGGSHPLPLQSSRSNGAGKETMAAADECFDAGTLGMLMEQIKGASLPISAEGAGFGGVRTGGGVSETTGW